MRIMYYFNPCPSKASRVDKIVSLYDTLEVVEAIEEYKGLRERLSLPVDEHPTIVIINNGTLEAVWRM
jgi:hypothetical protein